MAQRQGTWLEWAKPWVSIPALQRKEDGESPNLHAVLETLKLGFKAAFIESRPECSLRKYLSTLADCQNLGPAILPVIWPSSLLHQHLSWALLLWSFVLDWVMLLPFQLGEPRPLPVFADLRHDFQHGPVLRHPQKPRNGLESAPTPSRNNGPEDRPGRLVFCH